MGKIGSETSGVNDGPHASSGEDPKVEDLYKSDVDRRLWAPSPDDDNDEPGFAQHKLRRCGRAIRSALRWLFSFR